MKTLQKLTAAVLLGLAGSATAQYYDDPYYDEPVYAYEFAPRSGDPLLDELLYAVNALYAEEPEWYVEDIVRSTGAPRYYVEPLLIERRYAPADVYMMAEAARITGKSFDQVQREFDANRGEGWGVTARRLGIKPGSAEFHRLKDGAGSLSSRVETRVKSRGLAKRETPAVRAQNAKGKPAHARGYVKVKNNPGKGKGQGKAKGKGKDKG